MSPKHDFDLDPFFRRVAETEWNACIGPQGDEENYVDGYMEAAIYLSQVVLEKELHVSRDTLVLPILYNARHAIELALKFLIKQLHQHGMLHEAPKTNHDISKHFDKLDCLDIGDLEMRNLFKRLSPFVGSLAKIDDDGQQLRYAVDRSGKSSLQNHPLANLKVIHRSLFELSTILKKLKTRTRGLCEERKTGTFTARCSRSDLMAIAKTLADFSDSGGAEYGLIRQELKARYGLGNKTLQDAMEVIRKNRELGSLSGQEFTLKYLADEKVRKAVACWSSLHPPRDPSLPSSRIVKASEIRLRVLMTPSSFDAGKELLSHLTMEELIDIDTIFYLSRDGLFPEFYEQLYTQKMEEYQVGQEHIAKASHLMSKTNFLKHVCRGLAILGQRRLSSEISLLRPDLL